MIVRKPKNQRQRKWSQRRPKHWRTAIYGLASVILCGVLAVAIVGNHGKQVMTGASGGKLAAADASTTANWGLSFQKEGKTPIGNSSPEELAKYDGYFVGDETKKNIFLTFDVGYENGYTEKILDTLKDKKVPAAFFCVGTYLRDYGQIVKRMADEGHIVGNHTMNHPDMSSIQNIDNFKKELDDAAKFYKDVIGKNMEQFYRPPQGKYSKANLENAQKLGYKTIFWSLAYVDWYVDKQPTEEEAFGKLIPRIHPGAIVLLHTTSKTNCQILGELIDKWRDLGYTFKTLRDL